MGSTFATIMAAISTPCEYVTYYVLNDMACGSQCCASDAICTWSCETQGQPPLEGDETEVVVTDCCMVRHK
jgi:hypothetical protein